MTTKTNGTKDYSSEEEIEEVEKFDSTDQMKKKILLFEDLTNKDAFFNFLTTAHKADILSDLTIKVKPQTFQAHKLILAACSKVFFDLFKADPKMDYYALKDVDSKSFECLLNYAYSYKLQLDRENVISVYKAAIKLEMIPAAEACSQFLSSNLTTLSCLDVRHFATQLSDPGLISETTNYIQDNIEEVLSKSSFDAITCDVLGTESFLNKKEMQQLGDMVVDWLKTKTELQDEYLLCMKKDKRLRDVNQVDQEDEISNIEAVIDFKAHAKISHKVPNHKDRQLENGSNHGNELLQEKRDVIAVHNVSDNHCVVLADINGQICRLAIKYDIARKKHSQSRSSSECDNSLSSSLNNSMKTVSLTPLSSMRSSRSGLGVVKIDEYRFAAVGGYDRAFCLKSAEIYDVRINAWTKMPKMSTDRARFNITELDGNLYACGGSDGNKELQSAEYFDLKLNKWFCLPSMKKCRLFAGVTSLPNRICVIGGWAYGGLVDCEIFNVSEKSWSAMKPLNVARSQAAVCSIDDNSIFAAGGADDWNCLHTAEIYDSNQDTWTVVEPLFNARRGAGAAIINDKVYVVGGSDGQLSLSSVEIYDLKTKSWSLGPSLRKARTNLGVAVIEDCLYAIGGFSGKEFLSSMEVLRANETEWSVLSAI